MWRFVAILCLGFSLQSVAQQATDTPASKEDVEHYFQVIHSEEMLQKILDAMSKPMHQMVHEMYMNDKDKDKLPPDFEARLQAFVDNMWKDIPFDEMLKAQMPIYQKHFTKGDFDAMIAFYTTPTGKKLLRELPVITQEAMESMMPLLQKYVEKMRERAIQQFAAMKESLKKSADAKPSVTSNN